MGWLEDALADHVQVLYESLQEHESYEYMVRDGSDKVIYWGGEQDEAIVKSLNETHTCTYCFQNETTMIDEDGDAICSDCALPALIEYGYRITEGASVGHEVWQVDHGQDGFWLPANATPKIPAIDIYDGQEESAIRDTLARAGVVGIVITRVSA